MMTFLAALLASFLPQASAATAAADFTIAVLPDTQFYAKEHPDTFRAQVNWIIANRIPHNIVYVAHVGDVVDSHNALPQWLNATNALYRLGNPLLTGLRDGIPFGIVPGNHDHAGPGEAKFYNQYFGVSRFDKKPWYGGHFRSDNNNHFDRFSAGGMDFLVVFVDYRAPKKGSKETIDFSPEDSWADSILKSNPSRRAILVTHSAVNAKSAFTQHGQELYDRLKHNPNLFLILCGHVAGEGRRCDTFEGRAIHSCLADYQKEPNGGNGWLRLYRFSPAHNCIRVTTYSPTLDKWRTDPTSQFTLDYSMTRPNQPSR
jgi:hypothetical protein